MPNETISENGQSGKLSASADLRALLMVGRAVRVGNPMRYGSGKRSVLAYDKETLLAIEKNSASRTRPEFLDPEYDTPYQPSRWDPERWHSGTKPKSRAKDSSGLCGMNQSGLPTKSKNEDNWRKQKDKRGSLNLDDAEFEKNENEGEFRLGPQRRSYKEGCKPQNTRDEVTSMSKRNSSSDWSRSDGRRLGTDNDRWRRGQRDGEDDKFKDFRAEKPGHQRYNAAEKFGYGSRNYGRHMPRYTQDNISDEEEPEWMTDGPDTIYDTMDLDQCRLPDENKNQETERNLNRDSPELVAFNFATGGTVKENIPEFNSNERGLQEFNSKELDDLLEQVNLENDTDSLKVDSDVDEDFLGESKFSLFFNKTQQEKKPKLHNIDPSVWADPTPQMQQPPPDRNIMEQMRNITSLGPGFGVQPNIMKINPVAPLKARPTTKPLINPHPVPSQVISLEELEGRSPSGASLDNDPRPEVKAKLLNLTRQKSDFEAKNNIQRMMLLQHHKTPNVMFPHVIARPQNSFGLSDNIVGQMNGITSTNMPLNQPNTLEQQVGARGKSKESIYEYLMNEKRGRLLTPSEEKFLEKHSQQEMMAQLALRDEIHKQMAIIDSRNSVRQSGVNGLSQRDMEMFSNRHYQQHQKSISLERQKAQFDEFGRQKNGSDKVSSLTAFTPTSVMRKMVRNRDDGSDRNPGAPCSRQKITPLEHTGVLRVPKCQDPRKPKAQNKNILSNFSPMSPIQQPPRTRTPVNTTNSNSNMPPFLLQQLVFQQQMTQRNNIMQQDIFRQQKEQYHFGSENDENIHIQKLLNQKYPDF